MKKEPLSMMIVKVLLAVVIFTGLGTIIIGGAYLIGKQGVISLPHYQPSDKSECEIDSDCWLVYVNDYICLPFDTSLDNYKCLNSDEAKIFGGEKIDPSVMCSIPDVKFDRYTCECENGKCEKVKEELIEDITIITDKTEYEQGEMVEITIENNLDRTIFYLAGQKDCNSSPYNIHQFSNEKMKWVTVFSFVPICASYIGAGAPVFKELNVGEPVEFVWNQKLSNSIQAPNGKYKISVKYRKSKEAKNLKEIYSNEFTIKEKSALDPRCSEKVEGIGPCKPVRLIVGYEFDSNLGKCVEKRVGGCSFEIPFKTLEECQEVCEIGLSCSEACSKISPSANVIEISSLELTGGMYYGNLDQKKKGTPVDWVHTLEGTKSSSWRSPENSKSYKCDCN